MFIFKSDRRSFIDVLISLHARIFERTRIHSLISVQLEMSIHKNRALNLQETPISQYFKDLRFRSTRLFGTICKIICKVLNLQLKISPFVNHGRRIYMFIYFNPFEFSSLVPSLLLIGDHFQLGPIALFGTIQRHCRRRRTERENDSNNLYLLK